MNPNLLTFFQQLTILMSLVLSALMLFHYSKKKHVASLVWAVAWGVVALRVYVGMYLPQLVTTDILHSSLNALHDFLWLVGIAIILDMDRVKSVYLPAIIYSAYVVVTGLFTIKLGFFYSSVLMLAESTVLLFVVAWFFKRYHDKFRRKGSWFLWIGYFVWALDNLFLGVPYYSLGIQWVGVLGFFIGFFSRVLLFIGFYQLLFSQKDDTIYT